MRTRAEPNLYGTSPFSMPGTDLYVVDREMDRVSVIDLIGPLVGELPVHTFHGRIQRLLKGGRKNFAVNLTEVHYADSYGVGGLVTALNLARQAGARIKFFAVPERLGHSLERLRLDTVFELYLDEGSAVSSFSLSPDISEFR